MSGAEFSHQVHHFLCHKTKDQKMIAYHICILELNACISAQISGPCDIDFMLMRTCKFTLNLNIH